MDQALTWNLHLLCTRDLDDTSPRQLSLSGILTPPECVRSGILKQGINQEMHDYHVDGSWEDCFYRFVCHHPIAGSSLWSLLFFFKYCFRLMRDLNRRIALSPIFSAT